MKRYLQIMLIILMMVTLLSTACSTVNTAVAKEPIKAEVEASRIEKISIKSEILGKDMRIRVYLPKGYSSEIKYPTLYLLHGFGLEDELQWLSQVGTKQKSDQMIGEGTIQPMIIVSPQYDASCGYNTSQEKAYIDPKTKLAYGRYEDYICQEMIPYIDANYSTKVQKEGRFIGGFSGGGNAALYLGFKYDDLFSKIGAHCPGLWLDEQLDERQDLKDFLFPTEEARKERDPIYIAQEKDLSGRKIYLDSPKGDRWSPGAEKLANILKEKGADVQYFVNEGSHDNEYLINNLEKYLLFYGSNE